MKTLSCHTQAPAESLLGTLCRQIAWVDSQSQMLQGLIQRCVDIPLLHRLQADLLEMQNRATALHQLGSTAVMDQMSDQLSVAFYREVTRRTLNRFSRC